MCYGNIQGTIMFIFSPSIKPEISSNSKQKQFKYIMVLEKTDAVQVYNIITKLSNVINKTE